MRTEVFVCARCGQRKRLDRTKQHWCDVCASKRETEMHPARTKPVLEVEEQPLRPARW